MFTDRFQEKFGDVFDPKFNSNLSSPPTYTFSEISTLLIPKLERQDNLPSVQAVLALLKNAQDYLATTQSLFNEVNNLSSTDDSNEKDYTKIQEVLIELDDGILEGSKKIENFPDGSPHRQLIISAIAYVSQCFYNRHIVLMNHPIYQEQYALTLALENENSNSNNSKHSSK